MVTIKNAQPIPEKLYEKDGKLKWHVSDLYHGTTPAMVPRIMGQGLLPTIGAGSEQLKEQYGLLVQGVYVSKGWTTLSMYPIHPTTDPIPQNRNGVGGRGSNCNGRNATDESDDQVSGEYHSPTLAQRKEPVVVHARGPVHLSHQLLRRPP